MKKRTLMVSGFLMTLAVALMAWPNTSSARTEIYRLVDDPFTLEQCYYLGDWLEGPARYFDTDVCVQYDALNTVTTRIKTNNDGSEDVGWTLTQKGTATIRDAMTDEILYVGPFHVEEVGQDDGNDADCLGTASNGDPVAWLGKCGTNIWSTLDFARYHWKITGNKIYFYEFRANAPGEFCYMDDREVIFDGGGCPPGQ
jgi:hypothetical protein